MIGKNRLCTNTWIWVLSGWLVIAPMPLFAYEIKGVLHLNEEWQGKIYLSAIRSFQDINAISEDLIINVAPIATDGSFIISGNNLPEADGLYRLHVCKLGDPAATLIIGGKEENHLHFVLNNRSKLSFSSNQLLFDRAILQGHPANALLATLNENITRWKQTPTTPTKTNWEYNQQQLDRYLHRFADTCSNGLMALLATHYINVTQDYALHPSFYKKLLNKWEKQYGESLYYQQLAAQIEYLNYKKKPINNTFIAVIIAILLLITTILYWYQTKAKQQKTATAQPHKLSIQEQKVFDLLTEGKANKEISGALNIEISTVKSHVNSIYSKLGVKSRKELYKGKME